MTSGKEAMLYPPMTAAARLDSKMVRRMERMETLEERYAGDPVLLRLYEKKLPKPGWAGMKDEVEQRFSAATRKRQGRGSRGRPFERKHPAPSQGTARLNGDQEGAEDRDVDESPFGRVESGVGSGNGDQPG